MIRCQNSRKAGVELGLEEKVAVVNGASRGAGAAVATEHARECIHVCLCARNTTVIETVAGTATSKNSWQALSLAADPRTAGAAAVAAIARFIGVDLPADNSGTTDDADFFILSEDDWRDGFVLKSGDPGGYNPADSAARLSPTAAVLVGRFARPQGCFYRGRTTSRSGIMVA
jgi:NAD(P)-dependent dehydrogenase (short-subunit alcohol dehydrogenase family)